jgi:drug/metabolite transporter (DMT)-like permease
LSVFFVAVADWLLFGLDPSLATYAGGCLIIVAFALLAKEELGHGKH